MLKARNLIFLLLVVVTACSNLVTAAKKGDIAAVQESLSKDANINETDSEGFTALMHAANNGHIEVVKLLLDKGADVNVADRWGTTALMLASGNDHNEIVKLIKQHNEEK